MHFLAPQFMLAFIRDANTSRSVTEVFEHIYDLIGLERFRELFPVILGDNGSEFSNPTAIELTPCGVRRSRLFYCDPSAPYQKGAIENNHALIRRIIPKGTSLDEFTQEDITLVMNHVNSYIRKNLGDNTPHEVFAAFYGDDFLKKMGADLISPDDVIMHPSLLK
jgi:IS30 family transposase